MIADATITPWIAGDEVYGRAGKLRTFLADDIWPAASTGGGGRSVRRPGRKGECAYAWLATTSPTPLPADPQTPIPGELAFRYCHIPTGRPVMSPATVVGPPRGQSWDHRQ